jgi:hypothetical protein
VRCGGAPSAARHTAAAAQQARVTPSRVLPPKSRAGAPLRRRCFRRRALEWMAAEME